MALGDLKVSDYHTMWLVKSRGWELRKVTNSAHLGSCNVKQDQRFEILRASCYVLPICQSNLEAPSARFCNRHVSRTVASKRSTTPTSRLLKGLVSVNYIRPFLSVDFAVMSLVTKVRIFGYRMC
jgi:hypothetical protein